MQLKKILVFIIAFLSIKVALSQTAQHDLNHRRYWFYRARFTNDFVKIGPNQGDCISFPQRNYLSQNSPIANVGPDQMDQMNMYLAALALEYKLLQRNNQDPKETLKEIFYIIDTYNRLDEEADQFWSTTPPTTDYPLFQFSNDRNGFILREDMPQLYIDSSYNNANYLHFNYSKKEYNNNFQSTQLSFSGLPEINKLDFSKFNDYVGFNSNNHSSSPVQKTGLSIPHDKYYSMFFAFLFIVKYLPDNLAYVDENNVTHSFSDGETSIKKEVRNITNRCHPYLRGNTFGNPASNWTTEYPDGTNTQNLGSPMFLSYPTVNTICHINNNFPWQFYPCLGYSDALSITNAASYVTLSSIIFLPAALNNFLANNFNQPGIGGEDLAVFLAYSQASSNEYPGAVPIWLKMQQNTAAWDLEWADLARKVLHQNGVFTKQKGVYENPLNQANCNGPFNFNFCQHAGCEWSATDRMEHPARRSAGCPQTNNCIGNVPQLGAFAGNYPGVDYMLLHNLYYEHLNQRHDQNPNNANSANSYTTAFNLMDNKDEFIWPAKVGNFVFGVDATLPYGIPMNVKVFQNLTSRARVYANASPLAPANTIMAKLVYRAGKEITLLPENPSTNSPGFEVKAGADFHAYIKRYICGNYDYTNGMRQGNHGEDVHSSDYETDDMNTEIPIHYVEYPELSDADKYPVVNENNDSYYPGLTSGQNNDDISEEILIQQTNQQNNIDNTLFENIKRFEVLPNPSTGIFKVVTNKIDQNEILSITIIDMKGITVYSNPDFKTTEIDLGSYSKGVYMLHMNSSLGKKYSKRLNLVE